MAQRVLSFKKKTRLTVMNMHSKLLNSHSVHPPLSDGERVEPPTKFSKRGSLTGPQLLEGVCWERGGDFFHGRRGGGVQVSHKNKSKSEILNGKNVCEQKYFSLSKLRIQSGKFQLRI